jgi:hypothetical protein
VLRWNKGTRNTGTGKIQMRLDNRFSNLMNCRSEALRRQNWKNTESGTWKRGLTYIQRPAAFQGGPGIFGRKDGTRSDPQRNKNNEVWPTQESLLIFHYQYNSKISYLLSYRSYIDGISSLFLSDDQFLRIARWPDWYLWQWRWYRDLSVFREFPIVLIQFDLHL